MGHNCTTSAILSRPVRMMEKRCHRLGGHLWATSHPGYEFCLESTHIHAGGGSHGSLHVLDSVSPLWVAGPPEGLAIPNQARAVDVVPICLDALGVKHAV